MITFTVFNILAVLISSILGIALAWIMSRLMDRANDKREVGLNAGSFARALDAIYENPLATAVYYGARWVGLCLLMGLMFSRSV